MMCNCKECVSIREEITYAKKILATCVDTTDTYNRRLLREIADEIYRVQGLTTFDSICDEFINEIENEFKKGVKQ